MRKKEHFDWRNDEKTGGLSVSSSPSNVERPNGKLSAEEVKYNLYEQSPAVDTGLVEMWMELRF